MGFRRRGGPESSVNWGTVVPLHEAVGRTEMMPVKGQGTEHLKVLVLQLC